MRRKPCCVLFVLLAGVPCAVPRAEAQTHSHAAARRTPARSTPLNTARINDPALRDDVLPQSRGDAVVRASILLDRLKISPGEITSAYTVNLGRAIEAFQSISRLPSSGMMDAPTWAALNNAQSSGAVSPAASSPAPSPPNTNPPAPQGAQQQPQNQPAAAPVPALISYVITPEDVAGPFTTLPKASGRNRGEELMLREGKLKQLNYSSPLELIAEKFHASPHLLVELNAHKSFRKAGEEIEVPNVLTPMPQGATSVIVDGATKNVAVYDAQGKMLAVYPATIGSAHDPLPAGDWTVAEIDWYPHFKYDPKLFWDSENKHPRAIIAGGPRNPVGVVWIGLSKPHYGIHGTPAPSNIGRTESHGCIRLTNWDASELAKMVHKGIPVRLENGAPSVVPSQSSAPKSTKVI